MTQLSNLDLATANLLVKRGAANPDALTKLVDRNGCPREGNSLVCAFQVDRLCVSRVASAQAYLSRGDGARIIKCHALLRHFHEL